MPDPLDITRILRSASRDPAAADELLPLVYGSLRDIARSCLRRERPDHTLQATALVHEAWMRLLGGRDLPWEHRAHFFRTAAEAMRRVLIDHARRHKSLKRGGGQGALPLSRLDLGEEQDLEEVLALDEALETLAGEDPRAAEVVKLRFFAGLEVAEVAAAMGISERTVAREWAFARARLFALLGRDTEGGAGPGTGGSPS